MSIWFRKDFIVQQSLVNFIELWKLILDNKNVFGTL